MKHIPFSVAMSVYKNDEAIFFDRALQSITEEQTLMPNEIVLVVDGEVNVSIDEVIEKYLGKYPDIIKVVRLENNVGLGNALRNAIENCSYMIIARMDSDDVAAKTRFEEQLAFFEADETLDIVGGNISEFIGNEENIVSYRVVPSSHEDICEYLKKRCPFNHQTVMYKKTAVIEAGGYLDLFWNEDYYLWIRMFQHGAKMANSDSVFVNMRTGEGMYRRRGGKKYFTSEKFLQDYMLKCGIINRVTYLSNLIKRWIVQILLPNRLRGFVFKTFARRK